MRHHEETPLVHYNKKEPGDIQQVYPAPNNTSLLLLTFTNAHDDPKTRVIFGNQFCAEFPHPGRLETFDISPDGKKLAFCLRQRRGYAIYINNEWKYQLLAGQPGNLCWLSPQQLAWSAWFPAEGRQRYFVNGQEVTGRMRFQIGIDELGRLRAVVSEGDKQYELLADGERLDLSPDPRERDPEYIPPSPPEVVQTYVQDSRRLASITYRRREFPVFDQLEDNCGRYAYVFSKDGSKIAYIGIKSARAKTGLRKWFQTILDYANLDGLAPPEKYYPVDNGRVWKKGYFYAGDHFYTPADELVVTALNRERRFLVVSDEEEGPCFDEIWNARYLKDEGCVCYLARRGDEFFRVAVKGGKR